MALLWPLPAIAILRGSACSATGMATLSTPASYSAFTRATHPSA